MKLFSPSEFRSPKAVSSEKLMSPEVFQNPGFLTPEVPEFMTPESEDQKRRGSSPKKENVRTPPKKKIRKASPVKMTPEVLKLFYNNKKEALDIINTGGDILKHLVNVKNPICPLTNTTIELGEMLGEGHQGMVFQIKFPGSERNGVSQYVAKIMDIKPDERYEIPMTGMMSEPHNIERVKLRIEERLEELNIPLSTFLEYNGVTNRQWKGLFKGIIYRIPVFMSGCSAKYPYACDSAYSEYLLAIITGNFVNTGVCINFVDTFAFATCKGPNVVKQYMFMEQEDGIFFHYYNEIFKKEGMRGVESFFIQVLFALAVCEKHQIVHNDLHQDNIFVKLADGFQWDGEPFFGTDYDYYHYRLGERDIYITSSKYIAKLGDWGYGCKYSKPVICNRTVIEGNDQMDRPSEYNSLYDLVFMAQMFAEVFPESSFIERVTRYIHGGTKNQTIQQLYEQNMLERNNRPKSEFLARRGSVSATEILTNPVLMLGFISQPDPEDSFITLGHL